VPFLLGFIDDKSTYGAGSGTDSCTARNTMPRDGAEGRTRASAYGAAAQDPLLPAAHARAASQETQ